MEEQAKSAYRLIGDARYTQVAACDEPRQTACHRFVVLESKSDEKVLQQIKFQNGPIKEAGVNGVHNEDLLVIVLDRLQGFQNSEFKCRENAIAITKIEEALLWLNKRTRDREIRGVEGTHIV